MYMPGGDGTGPRGQGAQDGRGNRNQAGAGPVGECVCPACGTTIQHQRGYPCTEQSCPGCGARMIRK